MPAAIDILNAQRSGPDLTTINPAVADVTVPDLVLDGRPMDAKVVDPEEVGLERRLDGASNLTMSLRDPAIGDPPRPKLLTSGIFGKAVDLDLAVRDTSDPLKTVVQRLAFRLADRKITDLSGTIGLGLTFEATAVARLRRFKGAKHASRNDKTRAEFIKSLCDEAGVPLVCPDLHVKQPITKAEAAAGTAGTGTDPGGAVFSEGDSLAVGTEAPLNALLTRSITTHAVGGVPSASGRTSLQARHLPKTLLIQLGTNDTDVAVFRTNVQAIKQLRGVERIYWVNIARTPLGGTTDAQLNAVLKAEAGDKLKIIDWKGLVDSGQATLTDGVHPTAAGYNKRAKLIAMAMRSVGTPASLTAAERKANREKGMNLSGRGGTAKGKTAQITVKGVKADSEQLAVIQTAARAADALSAPALAELALFEALVAESTCRNLAGGDRDSRGALQVRDSTAAPIHLNNRDTEACCRWFLLHGFWGKGGAIALAKAHPDWDPGRIAQEVQGSGVPAGYEPWHAEAVKMMQAFGASGSLDPLANTSKDTAEPYAVSYQFKRLGREEATDNRDEDSWTCMRRLADEVNWRLWEEAGSIYFMTDDRILKSSVEMTVEPMQDGVYSLTGKDSNRRDHQEVTIECDARLWQAGIATVVELYGWGDPMDGRWIVSSISRPSLWEAHTTITLQRREAALLEPAHELRDRTTSTAVAASNPAATLDPSTSNLALPSPLSLRGRVLAIAEQCRKNSSADPNYYYYSQPGRWKGDVLARDPRPVQTVRSDCSSWIIGVYVAAGCKVPRSMQGQGNTETLMSAGRRTAKPQPGDAVLYDDHVELFIGGNKTIGHGTPAVDFAKATGPEAHGGFIAFYTFSFLGTPLAFTDQIFG